jgi:small neutral amino acid transporter SnatA (MarC family)
MRPSTALRVGSGTVAETQRQARRVTLLVLVILAVMWAAVLLPPWLRGRHHDRPSDSIHSFRRQLSVLERATPGINGQARPESLITLSEAQRRRRLIIGLLAVLASVTLLAAFTSTGSTRMLLFAVNLVIDAALVGYLILLAQARQVAAEREMKVHYLHSVSAPASTTLGQAERLERFEHSSAR